MPQPVDLLQGVSINVERLKSWEMSLDVERSHTIPADSDGP